MLAVEFLSESHVVAQPVNLIIFVGCFFLAVSRKQQVPMWSAFVMSALVAVPRNELWAAMVVAARRPIRRTAADQTAEVSR